MVKGKRKAEGAAAHLNQNDGTNEGKRMRVSKACDQCRLTREKCNGSRPCQSCASHSRECSYAEPSRKRGIQPNYIRALELAMAWTFKAVPEAEPKLFAGLTGEHHSIGRLVSGYDVEAAADLQDVFRTSSVCQQITGLLAGETTSSQHVDHPVSIEGPDAVTANRWYRSNPKHSVSSASQKLSASANRSAESSGSAPLDGTAAEESSRRLKLPDDVWKLLEHFWAFTQSWLPITEKDQVLKLIYAYPKEGLDVDNATGAEHAELWSIIALAASQLSDDNAKEWASQLRDAAEGLIPTARRNASYEVPHIKALLVMVVLDMSEGRILAAWLRIGTVVSILLLFPLLQNLGAMTRKCKQVHLAAFVLEQALASHLRVPIHSRVRFIEALGFVEEGGIEEWSPWHDPSNATIDDQSGRLPTKAHSTLNELVRIALHSSDQATTSKFNGNADIAIVSTLMKNATLNKNDRLHPHILLTGHASQSGAREANAHG